MKPKPHPTKYTVVMGTKLMRFDTLAEAEAARDKAVERGGADFGSRREVSRAARRIEQAQ